MQTISPDWLNIILAETTRRCLTEAGEATAPLGVDSSGVETSRYEEVERPSKKEQDFVQTRQKEYLQYRMAAILGLQIVLSAVGTLGYVNDTVMLPYNIRHHEFHLKGRRVNTDRVHNSDQNCQVVLMHGMILGSKQRKDAINHSKPSRRKAATLFNPNEYALSDIIEGIFGAEET
ncbi:MAG: hypothetical protein F4W68_05610 [Cenarchaeum sp. SB0661_bin_35]|nr:hypothetical protein [Cenarchaeum sp. SB0661_bin_35]